ncbi:MAG: Methyltransferase type 11, partial [Chitinophagaceae bacterium]|nr:Methyltransferase type 11 [Chitinophagaceae bacterium]
YTFLCAKASVETADLTPGFYKNIDPDIREADATKLPYTGNYFDLVIGNHILEHIPDDRQAMKEIFRVLRSPGMAILQVPFSTELPETLEDPSISNPEKQSFLFGQNDHVRIYSIWDYINRLRETGFTVEYLSYESLQPFYQFAIQPGEGFFKITK